MTDDVATVVLRVAKDGPPMVVEIPVASMQEAELLKRGLAHTEIRALVTVWAAIADLPDKPSKRAALRRAQAMLEAQEP